MLACFMAIRYIIGHFVFFRRFGRLYREKSGNGANYLHTNTYVCILNYINTMICSDVFSFSFGLYVRSIFSKKTECFGIILYRSDVLDQVATYLLHGNPSTTYYS
jgi:hypothetical protein